MNTKAKGYLLGAVAAATYGMNPLFALPLYKEGMDPDSVLFFRYLFAIPLVGAMLRVRRGWDFGLRARQIPALVVLGLLLSLSSLALFLSYNYMDAGIASTLLFVYPIMVALIMAVGFHERLTLQTALCILLAVAGIGLLYRAGDGATLSLTGTLLVMTSSLSYAIYIVGVNRPSLRELPTLKVTFYVLLFGLSLFLVRLDFGSAVTLPGRWYLWGNLVALALFPTAISFLCTTSAIQYIGSGARDGGLLRGDHLRRAAHAAHPLRHAAHHRGREPDCGGQPHLGDAGALPQALPPHSAAAPPPPPAVEAAQLSVSEIVAERQGEGPVK